MSDTKDSPNKKSLLKDLENIRESLIDEDDIPILTDSVGGESVILQSDYYDEKAIFEDHDHEAGSGSGIASSQASSTRDSQPDSVDSLAYTGEFASLDMAEDVPLLLTEEAEEDGEEVLRAAYRETLAEPPKVKAGKKQGHALEGQQSLFDDVRDTGMRKSLTGFDSPGAFDSEANVLPKAAGENPFLPQHVRERLSQGKNDFLEEIAQVSEALKMQPGGEQAKPEISIPKSVTQEKDSDVAASKSGISTEEPVRQSQAQAKPENSISDQKQEPVSTLEHEKLVDELVQEFLPQIEEALRQRLSEIVARKKK